MRSDAATKATNVHDIFWSANLEAEERRSKKVIQARRSDDGESDSRNDSAPEGQQHNDDHIGWNGRGDIKLEPEEDPGKERQSSGTAQQLRR